MEPPEPESARANKANRAIVVIDDAADLVELTVALLELRGYAAHGATSGPSGLRLAQRFPARLVVLDFRMPGMDGAQVGAVLRGHPLTRDIKIVMHTSAAAHQVRPSFDAYDAFVPKPAAAGELFETVDQLMAACSD